MSIGSMMKGKLLREMKAKGIAQRTRSASSSTPVAARASTSSTPRPTGTRKMFLGKLMEDAQNRVFKKKPEESVGMKKGGAVKPAKKAPAKKAATTPAKKSAKAKAPAPMSQSDSRARLAAMARLAAARKGG